MPFGQKKTKKRYSFTMLIPQQPERQQHPLAQPERQQHPLAQPERQQHSLAQPERQQHPLAQQHRQESAQASIHLEVHPGSQAVQHQKTEIPNRKWAEDLNGHFMKKAYT